MKTRIEPWEYDRAMYKRRNGVERLFRRLKGYRKVFSRFEKLDVMFINFALADTQPVPSKCAARACWLVSALRCYPAIAATSASSCPLTPKSSDALP